MRTCHRLSSGGSRTRPAVAKQPRRVLFINDTVRDGGPGRSLHSILRFLDPRIVHRTVVLPRPGAIAELLLRDGAADELCLEPLLVENPIEPWARAMRRIDFDAPAWLKLARLAGNGFKMTSGLARLAMLVRSRRVDLVYCNGTNADFAGAALARLTRVPALWHVRYASIPGAVRVIHRRLSASVGVRRIVCVSKPAASLFAHCRRKVTVIHNGLDVAHFDPESVRGTLRRELRLPGDSVVFGSHGRVLRRKGYVEMLRAARVALDAMTGAERRRIAFVVVGDTPEDFRMNHLEECRSMAARFGLSTCFFLVGFRTDVRPLVADFDVAVAPSVFADPLPRAVLESMSLAKPVIAFDIGGLGELVESGVTGELVPFDRSTRGGASSRAIERLARAFLRYARDRDLRERQGRAARARVVREFDARSHALRIQEEIVRTAGAGNRHD
jgi:glycosyltransferase involved in cell wall biosynthesis